MVTRKGVAGFTILLALCVIVFGAYVRLTDAGLGCPDWPGCYGFVTVPQTAEDYLSVEQNFPMEIVDEGKALERNDSPLYRLFTWFSYSLDVLKRLFL